MAASSWSPAIHSPLAYSIVSFHVSLKRHRLYLMTSSIWRLSWRRYLLATFYVFFFFVFYLLHLHRFKTVWTREKPQCWQLNAYFPTAIDALKTSSWCLLFCHSADKILIAFFVSVSNIVSVNCNLIIWNCCPEHISVTASRILVVMQPRRTWNDVVLPQCY